MRPSLASLRTRLAIVLALFLSLGVGGFFAIRALDEGTKDQLACTAMSCRSGISVRFSALQRALPHASTVQLCAGAGCVSERLSRGGAPGITSEWRGVPKHPNARYIADLTVFDRHGRVLLHLRRGVRLSKFEPNGHACGPTCYFAGLRLEAARGLLVPEHS